MDINKVKEAIKESRYKHSALAYKIGVTTTHFLHFLNGRRTITESQKQELLKLLGLKLD